MTDNLPEAVAQGLLIDRDFLMQNGSLICDGLRDHLVVLRVSLLAGDVVRLISETTCYVLEAFFQLTEADIGSYVAFAPSKHIVSPATACNDDGSLLMFLVGNFPHVQFGDRPHIVSFAMPDGVGDLWIYEFEIIA